MGGGSNPAVGIFLMKYYFICDMCILSCVFFNLKNAYHYVNCFNKLHRVNSLSMH